jgi:hypothetical protein
MKSIAFSPCEYTLQMISAVLSSVKSGLSAAILPRELLAIPDLLHQRHWFKFPCLSVVFADRPHPVFDGQNPIAGVFFVIHHAKDLLGYFQLLWPYTMSFLR